MKHSYMIVGLVCLSALSGLGQTKLFRGNWYVGTDVGIFSSHTRMIAGELTKYSSGGSGIMPMYGFKIGKVMNPYVSVETGLYSLPLNMVYLYQNGRAIGNHSLQFMSFPLRSNWRVRVFHDRLEAHIGAGLQYIWGRNQLFENAFSGVITSRGHTWTDSLVYVGSVGVLRQHSINAEGTVSFNWSISKRWTLSVYARQTFGLTNVANVKVAIRNNQEPVENAEFVARSGGFNTGIGLRYNLRPKWYPR